MSVYFTEYNLVASRPFYFYQPSIPFNWQLFASMDIDSIFNASDIRALQPLTEFLVHGDLQTVIAPNYNVPAWIPKVFKAQQFFAYYLLYTVEMLYLYLQLPYNYDQMIYLQREVYALYKQLKAERQKRQADSMMLRLASLKPELVEHMPRCMECGKAFGDYQYLVSHYQRRHPYAEIPPPPLPNLELKFPEPQIVERIVEKVVEKPVIKEVIKYVKYEGTSDKSSDIFLHADYLQGNDQPLRMHMTPAQQSSRTEFLGYQSFRTDNLGTFNAASPGATLGNCEVCASPGQCSREEAARYVDMLLEQ